MSRALVIGIGNPDRGDDAAGPAVAARVAALGLPEIDVVERADPVGLLTHLLDRDGDGELVVVVDAVAAAGRPGRLHVRSIDEPAAVPSRGSGGSHGLDVADVVAVARALGRCPPSVVLVGVEGGCFEIGHPMSGAVSATLAAAAEATVAACSRQSHACSRQSQGSHTFSQ